MGTAARIMFPAGNALQGKAASCIYKDEGQRTKYEGGCPHPYPPLGGGNGRGMNLRPSSFVLRTFELFPAWNIAGLRAARTVQR